MDNIKNWESIQSVIKIERIVNRGKKKLTKEISYFISSLSADNSPSFFSEGIRSHWSIENGLHYKVV